MLNLFQNLSQDVRLAVAQLRERPMFVIGATLSLAIGMSLATALFSIVNAALLQPLPFRAPQRLVTALETTPRYDVAHVSPRLLTTLRAGSSSFEAVAGFTSSNPMVGRSGEGRRISTAIVTTDLFDVLGVSALRGRTFDRSNGVDNDRSAIISYALWLADYGRDDAIIGREIAIGGTPRTIIGVMPPNFDFPQAKIWLPLPESELDVAATTRDNDWSPYSNVARLAPGKTVAEASAELAVVYRRLYGADRQRRLLSARASPLVEELTSAIRYQLRLWGAAAFVILLLCAVNFATMSLARGMRRRDEIAVRAALGASRYRIARMLTVEALLFALLAGAGAILFASWLLSFVQSLIAEGPLAVTPRIDWPTVAFAVGATLVVGFVFALAPALELAKVDLRAVMQAGSAASTSRRGELRGRRALVTLQLALALTAMAVVVALIEADQRNQVANIGFDYSRLFIAEVGASDSTVRRVAVEPLLDELNRTPGVESAAATGSMDAAVMLNDRAQGDAGRVYVQRASPQLFATLGVGTLAGRFPTDDEIRSEADVMVASRSTAVATFGSATAAVGKRVRIKSPRVPQRAVTIVGVIPDIGGNGLYGFSASLYSVCPLRSERAGVLAVRVAGDPNLHIKDIRRTLGLFDHALAASDVQSARAIVDRTLGATRGRAIFLSSVAVLAFLLAIIGVYGLTSYTTELRAREVGIRIALGAGASHVAYIVLEDLWWMAVLGLAVGAIATARLVIFLDTLYRNPMVTVPLVRLPVGPMIASAIALGMILVVGTAVPLRRILRIDVMRTIQSR